MWADLAVAAALVAVTGFLSVIAIYYLVTNDFFLPYFFGLVKDLGALKMFTLSCVAGLIGGHTFRLITLADHPVIRGSWMGPPLHVELNEHFRENRSRNSLQPHLLFLGHHD
jgi:hypothetical protein